MDTGLWHAGSVQGGLARLSQGEVLRLHDAAGRHVGVACGNVWVTQERDPRDRVLGAGSSLRLTRDGLTLVMPLGGDATVVLEEGLAAQSGTVAPEHAVVAATRDAWRVHSPELEHAARRLRARVIARLAASVGRVLAAAWRGFARAAAASLETRRTARELGALSDHLLKDLGLRRDQIDCVARRVPC
jgi:uncharacterized protein YjiS (DUF1127 family)